MTRMNIIYIYIYIYIVTDVDGDRHARGAHPGYVYIILYIILYYIILYYIRNIAGV